MLIRSTIVLTTVVLLSTGSASADPCGMVPPIYQGDAVPIARTGEQQTYVFFRNGIETFVIRPGFTGRVDEFGMLIPFPSVPAVRKVSDDIFSHIRAAVDPPEVVIDLRVWFGRGFGGGGLANRSDSYELAFRQSSVRVVRQEAVGMYEVAVLEAGSAAALKKWMGDHGYRYPDGMDEVCDEYVADGWCFVAIKAKVGQKRGADPQPGQRSVDTTLPDGSTFDGHVQAMGFRFKTDELVVPMRLSAFNEGSLRNIVYLLTDIPQRIKKIPEELVVRQIPGHQLIDNVSKPLPVRIIGGTEESLPKSQRDELQKNRDPEAKSGQAKELFAADLLSVRRETLSLAHEEEEKELLRIGERFGLRGADIDRLNGEELSADREKTVRRALQRLAKMTLTVIDGEFPRDVLASDNLKFTPYRMARENNNPQSYDANHLGPAPKREGVRISRASLEAASGWSPWLVPGLGLMALGLIVKRAAFGNRYST